MRRTILTLGALVSSTLAVSTLGGCGGSVHYAQHHGYNHHRGAGDVVVYRRNDWQRRHRWFEHQHYRRDDGHHHRYGGGYGWYGCGPYGW